MTDAYDAVLLVAYGGPEKMDDVLPFLENALRGRNIPRARLEAVGEHYKLFDGVSPINAQCRALRDALQREIDLPVYWGNRNWHPLLTDELSRMRDDGIQRAMAFFTSPYSSYSSCRQYRENIAEARAQVGDGAPQVDKLRTYFDHADFIAANADRLREAQGKLPDAHVVFTAHSIPIAMADNCDYVAQLQRACHLTADACGVESFDLAWQSRSGPPHQPWLEPDICDHLRDLHARGVRDVIVMPIGFICDHMEVIYDLDTEAAAVAEEIGVNMVRAGTVGVHPRFIAMIRDLIDQRIAEPQQSVCGVDCCLPA